MDNGPPDFLQTEWEEQLSKISWILPPNSQWEWFIRVKKPMSCGCFTNLKAFSCPGNGFAVAPCSWSPSPREGTTVLINLKDHHPKIIPQPSTLNIHRFSTNQLSSSLNSKDKTKKNIWWSFFQQTNFFTAKPTQQLSSRFGSWSFRVEGLEASRSMPRERRNRWCCVGQRVEIRHPLVLWNLWCCLVKATFVFFSRRAFENSPRCDVRKGKNIQLERRFGWEHPYHTVKTWWND